jgi:tetratricopeptide (TPR) repeat protein
MGLERYFQLEGFAYRLVPIDSGNSDFILNFGRVNTERLQENLMEKFQWGNINTTGVFLDFTNIRTFSVIRIRNKFARLANALSAEERKEEAAEALDRVMELMPHDIIPFDFYINEIIKAYYTAGKNEKAVELLQEFMGYHRHDLDYYLGLKPENMQRVDYDVRVALQQFQETVRIAGEHESEEMGKQLEDEFNDYYMRYIERMSNIR